MRKPTTITLVPLLAVAVALTSCGDGEKDSRGIDYIPDMYESPAYKSQQAQVAVVKDGKVDIEQTRATLGPKVGKGAEVRQIPMMMAPPAGTVPRDFTPYQLEMADILSAKSLRNPLAPTADVLRRGQASFAIYCAVCHGNDGDAKNGYVAHRFAGIPSLNAANVPALTDGEIFHVITTGKPRMPNYRAQLLPEQRWAVVHYVRALNRAGMAAQDTAAMLKLAEEELKSKPDDAKAKADVELKTRIAEQAKRDLEAIKKGGGAEFAPPAAPRPEYDQRYPEK